MFAFNVALAVWIVRAFRLQPGHDLTERVKQSEALARQIVHNHTNVMQALEFEQYWRKENSKKIDRVIQLLEAMQADDK